MPAAASVTLPPSAAMRSTPAFGPEPFRLAPWAPPLPSLPPAQPASTSSAAPATLFRIRLIASSLPVPRADGLLLEAATMAPYDERVAMAGKDSGSFLASRRPAQRRADLGHHARPVAAPGLAEEALAGIPGIVGAGAMVAPVRQEGQRHPARAAERAGQMCDRGVHGDHQVEHGHRRCRLGEIGQMRAEIDEAVAEAELGDFGHARADLQIVETDAGHLEQRQEGGEGRRAVAVVGLLGIAAPGQADAQPGVGRSGGCTASTTVPPRSAISGA